jgi:predicted acylesterase/phospholipase RssA
MENTQEHPNIQHIVISGGCIWGLYEYGALKELHKKGFWNIKNIKSIYGTSVGAFIAVILALKIDFETIDTYLIDRPWIQVFKQNAYNLLEIYNNCGVFNIQVFYDTFSPLFKSCDMETSITMDEFYLKTGIEIHIYVTELNAFEPMDISYKTHPDWNVIEAIYASCSIPTLFSPIIKNTHCYIDGGFFHNYPLRKCLENIDEEERDCVLGVSIGNSVEKDDIKMIITTESTFLDFVSVLLNRIIKNIMFSNEDAGIIKYEICFLTQVTTLDQFIKIFTYKEDRQNMIEYGCEKAREFYENQERKNIVQKSTI